MTLSWTLRIRRKAFLSDCRSRLLRPSKRMKLSMACPASACRYWWWIRSRVTNSKEYYSSSTSSEMSEVPPRSASRRSTVETCWNPFSRAKSRATTE